MPIFSKLRLSIPKDHPDFYGELARINKLNDDYLVQRINARKLARYTKNYTEADRLRREIEDEGGIVFDNSDGTTDYMSI